MPSTDGSAPRGRQMTHDGPGTPLRRHGAAPYRTAVLHGGPGATGDAAPLARRLSRLGGVLEPLQRADSVDGQIEELAACLREAAALPATLIGHSWGAWLGILLAGRHPQLVARLVLVGCPPLEQRYAAAILETRLARLTPPQRREALALLQGAGEGMNRLGRLFDRADSYDPLPAGEDDASDPACVFSPAIHARVWPQAAALRESGALLRVARSLTCPVIALHGDHDPHPAAGVFAPLAGFAGLRCIVLPRCGHTPWRERQACERFFRTLAAVIDEAAPPSPG